MSPHPLWACGHLSPPLITCQEETRLEVSLVQEVEPPWARIPYLESSLH